MFFKKNGKDGEVSLSSFPSLGWFLHPDSRSGPLDSNAIKSADDVDTSYANPILISWAES